MALRFGDRPHLRVDAHHPQAARDDLDREFRPAGYDIGINDGGATGQTVSRLHVHRIPRYVGDRDDPRRGVRWLLPDKAAY